MKTLIVILQLLIFSLPGISQTISSGEKIALQLDSISKVYAIKDVGIYFHPPNPNKELFSSELVESFDNFKFKGQFVIFNESEKNPQYYNLNKLVHFKINKKQKNLELYFDLY